MISSSCLAITGKRLANLILAPKVGVSVSEVAGVPWLTLPCYLFGSCRAVTGTSYLSYLYGLEPRFGWDVSYKQTMLGRD